MLLFSIFYIKEMKIEREDKWFSSLYGKT
jgi:hypothetical protein